MPQIRPRLRFVRSRPPHKSDSLPRQRRIPVKDQVCHQRVEAVRIDRVDRAPGAGDPQIPEQINPHECCLPSPAHAQFRGSGPGIPGSLLVRTFPSPLRARVIFCALIDPLCLSCRSRSISVEAHAAVPPRRRKKLRSNAREPDFRAASIPRMKLACCLPSLRRPRRPFSAHQKLFADERF